SGARRDAALPAPVRRRGLPAGRQRDAEGDFMHRVAAQRVLRRGTRDAVVSVLRAFELSTIGGPWGKRLAAPPARIDELPWDGALPHHPQAAPPRGPPHPII